jgi:hypothetical protein
MDVAALALPQTLSTRSGGAESFTRSPTSGQSLLCLTPLYFYVYDLRGAHHAAK